MSDDNTREFEARYEEIRRLVERRRSSWVLTTLPWEDVSSMLMARIWKKFHLYDRTKPLDRWVNTVATNGMKSLLRDHCFKHARPCISADSYGNPCVFNLGNETCSKTPSGKQCSECWAYRAWEQGKKKDKFLVATPLPLENHVDEAHSRPGSELTQERVDNAKRILDEKIIKRLSKEEARIYYLLYVKHLDEKEVGRRMRFRPQKNSEIRGYLILRAAKIKFEQLAQEIIRENGL